MNVYGKIKIIKYSTIRAQKKGFELLSSRLCFNGRLFLFLLKDTQVKLFKIKH